VLKAVFKISFLKYKTLISLIALKILFSFQNLELINVALIEFFLSKLFCIKTKYWRDVNTGRFIIFKTLFYHRAKPGNISSIMLWSKIDHNEIIHFLINFYILFNNCQHHEVLNSIFSMRSHANTFHNSLVAFEIRALHYCNPNFIITRLYFIY